MLARRRLALATVGALLVTACSPAGGQGTDEQMRRARVLDSAGRFDDALALYDQVLERSPDDADALYLRANARYRSGRVAESVVDFDRFVEQVPSREPYLWQRGIAQYQIGRYSECAAQFEIHRTVNPDDVENAAWHFLCVAHDRGVEAAREELLPVGPDSRIPMAEIYELFAGRADRAPVLDAAVRPGDPEARRAAHLYAHLYLGLYAEALGDRGTALREIREAVAGGAAGYMADVARIHLQLLEGTLGEAGDQP